MYIEKTASANDFYGTIEVFKLYFDGFAQKGRKRKI